MGTERVRERARESWKPKEQGQMRTDRESKQERMSESKGASCLRFHWLEVIKWETKKQDKGLLRSPVTSC